MLVPHIVGTAVPVGLVTVKASALAPVAVTTLHRPDVAVTEVTKLVKSRLSKKKDLNN